MTEGAKVLEAIPEIRAGKMSAFWETFFCELQSSEKWAVFECMFQSRLRCLLVQIIRTKLAPLSYSHLVTVHMLH